MTEITPKHLDELELLIENHNFYAGSIWPPNLITPELVLALLREIRELREAGYQCEGFLETISKSRDEEHLKAMTNDIAHQYALAKIKELEEKLEVTENL